MPVAGASEFDANPIKPVRLLGEDLVLYRDGAGRYGLIDRHCPHRRADLSYGWVEEAGIRCSYHGWLMDAAGSCIEQPYEDIANPSGRAKARCTTKAYPVRELAGLLWAYLGPQPAPQLPVWEPFTWDNGFREVVLAEVPCNWFQCQENSCDPVHFEWMHDNWGQRLTGADANTAAKHLKLKFEEFEHGFIYKRVREGQSEEDRYWTVGRVALWPNGFYLGSHFEWRVPVDDENTLSVAWFFMRVPKGREPYVQEKVPTWVSPIKDASGRWISSHVINQDIVAWAGQGVIADRTRENLRSSDIGITMMRQRFFNEMDAVKAGREPKGVMRDAAAAKCVALPNMMREINTEGIALAEFQNHPLLRQRLKEFRHHAGQPAEVRRAFEQAMGIAG
jgi:5,5'-dehydrodivanillate O-demethylase